MTFTSGWCKLCSSSFYTYKYFFSSKNTQANLCMQSSNLFSWHQHGSIPAQFSIFLTAVSARLLVAGGQLIRVKSVLLFFSKHLSWAHCPVPVFVSSVCLVPFCHLCTIFVPFPPCVIVCCAVALWVQQALPLLRAHMALLAWLSAQLGMGR